MADHCLTPAKANWKYESFVINFGRGILLESVPYFSLNWNRMWPLIWTDSEAKRVLGNDDQQVN